MTHGLSVCFVFFFFKQKTAYEMRISDWSSDVCSSDLETVFGEEEPARGDAVGLRAFGQHADVAARAKAATLAVIDHDRLHRRLLPPRQQIGRASCRERVCQYV